jgi:hypothetical protein
VVPCVWRIPSARALRSPPGLEMGRATRGKEAFGQAGKSFECQWLLSADFVRMGLEAARFPTPFQAEYEGSIPFTRSSALHLSYCQRLRGIERSHEAHMRGLPPFALRSPELFRDPACGELTERA